MRNMHGSVFSFVTILAVGLGTILLTQHWTVTAADEHGIRFQRTALIADGKAAEARAFALEIANYINTAYPGSNVRVYMEAFGQLGRVHWFSDHKDLAALEQRTNRLRSDQKYQALVAKAAGLFVEGTGKDTLYAFVQ